MTKVIIRETIIALLVCLAVLLILSVTLYNYIPSNKVIPEAVEYKPSQEIEQQLSSEVEDNSEEIIMTYEITAQDLDNYEKTNEYNPGKANPFAAVSIEAPDTDGNGEGSGNGDITGTNIGTPDQDSSNNNSNGSLFENGTSK